jgi:hypothetical protein
MPLSPSLRALATLALMSFAPLAAAGNGAAAAAAAACENVFRPQVGQAGKDVIWVPTPDALVREMLSRAGTTAEDQVVDLGAGDGKIAIAAARDFGARAVGIEYNPDMVRLAQCHVQAAGVSGKVTIVQGDIFKEDFRQATVVTMYLLPELNLCVRHRLLAMRPGTRVTSHAFTMGEWEPDERFEGGGRSAYLWRVPAKVAGQWSVRGPLAGFDFTLQQSFQKVGGEVTQDGVRMPMLGARIEGTRLQFSFVDPHGVVQHFSASVNGSTLRGEVRSGNGVRDLEGTLRQPGAAPTWTAMLPDCQRFYR